MGSSTKLKIGVTCPTIFRYSWLPVFAALFLCVMTPGRTSALDLNDVTNSVTTITQSITLGKDQPDPIYVPAASNAPSAANSAPSTTTPNKTLMAEAIAASGTTQSGNTHIAGTANKASAAMSAQGKIIQTKDNLYKTTALTAQQRTLARRTSVAGIVVGGGLFAVGFTAYIMSRFLRYKRQNTTKVSPKVAA